ncbi:helix-turn-helix transcriptional regulator [Candidatus Nanohalobium constans]|uniref:Transcriptional regulator n=1 Tax=Candidatus Nanohalobium constans TaxID=2565781 RepID=A0A5Q0UH98_9ARCH|nr:helix-turn-helix transcriptional regulator [Candidatus Nanohalobium constans]QGA80590.1 transcriptional regulator [Candidatus Nanohalobium constans]
MKIENQMKKFRKKEDITQAELAEEVGVSRQTINAIETGKYDPSLELALKISDFFSTDVEKIFKLKRG